ncbi:Hypothetical protein Minf_0266 [Methylacidiphilum infernorum V4]|uniref:Uncharacterized protein n=1 Tax=Methylacidiphilum infernorum (isolate V4) TaxID=481448 RepID=B3DY49_METI4|nr:Hypothetical protein Minf_0266 [Methylacidiphilum infernorum V4]
MEQNPLFPTMPNKKRLSFLNSPSIKLHSPLNSPSYNIRCF